jgi:hypothetical protein
LIIGVAIETGISMMLYVAAILRKIIIAMDQLFSLGIRIVFQYDCPERR